MRSNALRKEPEDEESSEQQASHLRLVEPSERPDDEVSLFSTGLAPIVFVALALAALFAIWGVLGIMNVVPPPPAPDPSYFR